MRILGFSEKWYKLSQEEFTTFRFPRRDKDWVEGEVVQVVFKPRSKEREIFGVAEIISKELRHIFRWTVAGQSGGLSNAEAVKDGFKDKDDMLRWLNKAHGDRIYQELMNKLTLRWRRDVQNV